VHDRSHTPHRLQTTLTPAQEAVAVVRCKTLLVSIAPRWEEPLDVSGGPRNAARLPARSKAMARCRAFAQAQRRPATVGDGAGLWRAQGSFLLSGRPPMGPALLRHIV